MNDKPWLQRKAVGVYCRACMYLSRLLGRWSNAIGRHAIYVEVEHGPTKTARERNAWIGRMR